MKRKLNEHDVPEAVTETAEGSQKAQRNFTDLGLDPRLLQAITREKFAAPTAVQAQAIPLALAGKDISARAKTGSGKTAAYVLPVLHSILKRKSESTFNKCTSALILVPTKELAGQVTKTIQAFTAFCAQDVRTENLTRKEDDKVQRARLLEAPDIVVATPGRANILINASVSKSDNLAYLVIDEADLVSSYGHGEDSENIAKSMPPGVQSFLMSATSRSEVDTLKSSFCREPVVSELDEEEKEDANLNQYVVKCAEDEKFSSIYAIFMSKSVKGKCIVFVADIDRCYRLKSFLEQFGVKSCVLNSELPVNSRIHVVEEFNRNVYDIIIASDENEVIGNEEKSRKRRKVTKDEKETETGEGAEKDEWEDEPQEESATSKKRKKTKADKEYGVSRGIDFKNVACVLNFDSPTTTKSYTHRVGRTARAGKAGMALSFVIPKHLYRKHKPTSIASAANDEEVLAKITKSQEKKGQQVQPYNFDMKRLDGFRYRMGDASRSVTRIVIREARTRESRQESLKSEKSKRHFEENPEDLQHSRHDQESHAVRTQPHLKHVPEYLSPGGAKQVTQGEGGLSVGFNKLSENRIRSARMKNRMKNKKPGGRKADPLKTLSAKR